MDNTLRRGKFPQVKKETNFLFVLVLITGYRGIATEYIFSLGIATEYIFSLDIATEYVLYLGIAHIDISVLSDTVYLQNP